MLHVRRRFDATNHRFAVGSSLGMTPRHRVVAATLDGDCVLDPSLMPREPDPPRTYLLLVLDGELCLRDRDVRLGRGAILVCRSRAWLNDEARMVAFGGYRAVMMHVDRRLLRPPRGPVFEQATRSVLRSAEALHEALCEDPPAGALLRAHDDLVVRLRAAGVALPPPRELASGPIPSTHEHVAAALAASLSMRAGNPAIVDVAELVARAERTTRRRLAEVAASYGFAYPRFQTLRQKWRLAIASLLLTLPEATPEGVRREVAFASTSTLCHALARAGLPTPREIQRRAGEVRASQGFSVQT